MSYIPLILTKKKITEYRKAKESDPQMAWIDDPGYFKCEKLFHNNLLSASISFF